MYGLWQRQVGRLESQVMVTTSNSTLHVGQDPGSHQAPQVLCSWGQPAWLTIPGLGGWRAGCKRTAHVKMWTPHLSVLNAGACTHSRSSRCSSTTLRSVAAMRAA